ncbi:26S proteasome non-ATPase regulatory subunit 1-like [Gracilariopsis chorda]|uniref:26S proteasome non-ATPase regulatory subunit 1-like n=1 Tax=Gracilariopsis chorda TaxID=448386 RepID=A0A2V3IRY0_9FLOR|nr:26S proteasome non-ATPase regulatory subunit 1-like [Gracilariopsis chorda]|eukprot:PXF44863.1 26S proteasome non-ATPase regulatory subunit 1-like [Gracilariopsis chorda]
MGVAVESIVPSSAAPALSLLEEPEPILQAHALRALNTLADSFWPEISGAVVKIQELSEDDTFLERNLAAIVAAKVNFHLGSLDEALHYALSAGHLFDVDAESQFANTLRARCIDEYISIQRKREESTGDEGNAATSAEHAYAASLQSVVERVLTGCVKKGEIHEAIGVAIEAHRLDSVQAAITEGCKSDEAKKEALAYCFESAQNLISSRAYRAKVLNLIASIHIDQFPYEARNYIAVANCYAFTGNAKGVADILLSLVDDAKVSGKENESNLELMALQIAFDVVDNDAPFFAAQVLDLLPEPRIPESTPTLNPVANSTEQTTTTTADEPVPMETETPTEANNPTTETPEQDVVAEKVSNEDNKVLKLRRVLKGEATAEFYFDFLCSKNKSDMYLLKKLKQSLDGRSSVCDSALLFCNAIAHSGTAIDNFLRENLEWLARHTAWAKFSATSCLGVIHARHTSAALNLLSPYLPSSSASRGSAASYSEGGALYALGLIAASGGRNATLGVENNRPIIAKKYLCDALRVPEINEVVKHGACLGLGLSAMASWDGKNRESEFYEELKNVLYTDSAVASEAAGVGMGLIALGSGSEEVCNEMYAYAEETEHQKIIRGLALGIALVNYGREDEAMPMIKKMLADNEPIMRYGAMYAVALAYCGTADNNAIRMLLHSAVSDVSDDVRRAAVIALGFVLFKHPKLLPNIVSLLAESCHAHVRYGAAIAIGICCIGTGMSSAATILEKLISEDPVDFVRQGAFIGLSLVYMHHTAERSPKSVDMRKTLEATWGAKLEDVITRFGAVVAAGIADSGGRNGTVALASANGHPRMTAIVGLAMFTQFWYWFPFVHFIGLTIKPSALICLNKDVKMPKMKVQSNISEDVYAYVPSGPPEKTKEVASAPKAILSVTAKSLAREKRRAAARKKDGKSGSKGTDTADKAAVKTGDKKGSKKKDDAKMDEDKASKEEKAKIAPYTVLENPCRVLPAQEKYISWDVTGESEQRYEPIISGRVSGIVMVRDRKPDLEEEIVPLQTLTVPSAPASTARQGSGDNEATGGANGQEEDDGEIAVPETFIYLDEDKSAKKSEGTGNKDADKDKDNDINMDGGETNAEGGK